MRGSTCQPEALTASHFRIGIGAEVSNEGTNGNTGKCRNKLFEPIAAMPDVHEVVTIVPKPPGKSLANAGRRTGDKCQPPAAVGAIKGDDRKRRHLPHAGDRGRDDGRLGAGGPRHRPTASGMRREIRFLVHPGFQLLDLSGPLAVFQVTGQLATGDPYQLRVMSRHGGAVRSSSLWTMIGQQLEMFSMDECRNYLANPGDEFE